MVENLSTNSDLELFTRELSWDTRPIYSRFYSPVIFGALGFALATSMNFLSKRPLLSGIQRHVALTALGIPAGVYADQWLQKKYAMRDAALVAFMRAYPEDFPVKDRLKIKDSFEPWLPRR